ncbi:MAG: glycerate kinase [Muribaculaceae bacterium]|nr:glycerate kinase [Muribaculaceae bacterium]
MKVVLAFDKFKGSATAQQLNEAAQQCLCGLDNISVVTAAVADGGDGTTQVLAAARPGQWMTVPTMAPLLQMAPVMASYYLCDDGTALIEVAAASGLALLPAEGRDVMRTTSLGTGMLMRDAMEHGARHIVLGLGGTATCDAGMGILCALGAEFLDDEGHHLYPSGVSLEKIARIETLGIPPTVKECRFSLLTDVTNPLCGENGSARVFGPQKGGSPEQVELLEKGLAHVAALVGDDIACKAGCGAAGGIPSLMMHLLDCELLPGAPYVLGQTGFETALDGADLVITGEGRLDEQTLMGKGPGCVIGMARGRGIPVVAVCGTIDKDFDPDRAGLLQGIAVSDGLPADEAMDTDSTLMRVARAVYEVVMNYKKS